VPFTVITISKVFNSDSIFNALQDYSASNSIPDNAIVFKKIKIQKYYYNHGFKIIYFDKSIIIFPCQLFSLLGTKPKEIKVDLLSLSDNECIFSAKLSDQKIRIKGYRK
jgi:hypothetical protein